MNRDIYVAKIKTLLNILKGEIKDSGKLNLLDINVHVEDFYRDLLNLVYGWQLKNMNQWNQNAAGFTKNAYDGALNWSELLTDLVGEAYGREIQEMY